METLKSRESSLTRSVDYDRSGKSPVQSPVEKTSRSEAQVSEPRPTSNLHQLRIRRRFYNNMIGINQSGAFWSEETYTSGLNCERKDNVLPGMKSKQQNKRSIDVLQPDFSIKQNCARAVTSTPCRVWDSLPKQLHTTPQCNMPPGQLSLGTRTARQ